MTEVRKKKADNENGYRLEYIDVGIEKQTGEIYDLGALYLMNRDKINKLFIDYVDEKITREQFISKTLPAIIAINNQYARKFYNAFSKTTLTYYKMNNINIVDHQHWGLDNTFKIFFKCIDTFNFDKVIVHDYELKDKLRIEVEESRFFGFFKMWLDSEFSNQLKKIKNRRFNKDNEFIHMEEISMDNDKALPFLHSFSSMFTMIDEDGSIELDIFSRDFLDHHLLDPTDSAIFGYMLNKYYFGETYIDADIARFVKLTTRQVKYRKSKIKDLFMKYLNEMI